MDHTVKPSGSELCLRWDRSAAEETSAGLYVSAKVPTDGTTSAQYCRTILLTVMQVLPVPIA